MKWIKQHRTEVIVLLVILLVASFLRFYRLPEYMTFLGDEGRDAMIIKKILVERDLPFIGPPTSVGNIYLGPFYYYMMAASMTIFWLNPVAAAGMVALIGVATVFLVYYLARQFFGVLPAVVSGVLYALSPVNITYSRSSWNPNPAPFFALLAFVGLYQARQSKNFLWFILSGMALGAAVQMHYLALILIPIIGLLWLQEILKTGRREYQHFILGTIGAFAAFLLLITPLILFDFKHNFMNYRAMAAMFTQSDSSVGFSVINTLGRIVPIYHNLLIGRYLGTENVFLTFGLSVAVFVSALTFVYSRVKRLEIRWPYFALGVWLVIGLVGLSFYKQEIYDHYLGFLNPVPFLLLGGFVGHFKGKQRLILSLIILLVVGTLNIVKVPLQNSPNNQLQRTQQIARFVIVESKNQPFNFALLAEQNYDAAYQYYLDLYGHKPKIAPLEITDQLFVVCEDKECNPIGHAKYEIAAYGWARVDNVSDILGVKVYKLIPNPSGKPS